MDQSIIVQFLGGTAGFFTIIFLIITLVFMFIFDYLDRKICNFFVHSFEIPKVLW